MSDNSPDIQRTLSAWVANPRRDLCPSCLFRKGFIDARREDRSFPAPKAECRWVNEVKLGCDAFAPRNLAEVVEVDREEAERRAWTAVDGYSIDPLSTP